MVSLETIAQKVSLARAYYAELIAAKIADLTAGYCPVNQDKIVCLNRLIRALNWDIAGEYNTTVTQRLYELLLQEIVNYSGSYLPVDPSVVTPGTTIIVVQSYTTPVKLYFTDDVAPGVADWQADYADTFGNDPTLALYTYNGTAGSYSLNEGVSPTLQFTNASNLLLESFVYDFGVASTGYILIST